MASGREWHPAATRQLSPLKHSIRTSLTQQTAALTALWLGDKEQQIASVLTTADKKIKNLQEKPDCLKQEKKALMQQQLTGKRRL